MKPGRGRKLPAGKASRIPVGKVTLAAFLVSGGRSSTPTQNAASKTFTRATHPYITICFPVQYEVYLKAVGRKGLLKRKANMVDQFTTTDQQDQVIRQHGADPTTEVTITCWKCDGTGFIDYYSHVFNGECFACTPGTRKRVTTVKELLRLAKNRDSAAATRARKAAAQEDALAQWKTDNAELVERGLAVGIDWVAEWDRHPTEKQIAALEKVAAEREERARKDAERLATAIPVPNERREISGRIISTKRVDDYYSGSVLKMLVEAEEGFRVWGSVPRSVDDDAFEHNRKHGTDESYYTEHLSGAEVTFSATLERSRDDKFFGFFKRPTKAVVVFPS